MSDESLNENASVEADDTILVDAPVDVDIIAEVEEELVEAGEVRFDKLKKAEEILRSSAPASFREASENTF